MVLKQPLSFTLLIHTNEVKYELYIINVCFQKCQKPNQYWILTNYIFIGDR
jgi:hypothetical protein